jgi:hypothetical protein
VSFLNDRFKTKENWTVGIVQIVLRTSSCGRHTGERSLVDARGMAKSHGYCSFTVPQDDDDNNNINNNDDDKAVNNNNEKNPMTTKKRLEAVVFGSVWLLLSLNLFCLVLSLLYGAKALGLEEESCPARGVSFLVWNAILTSLFQAMVFHYICSLQHAQQQQQDDDSSSSSMFNYTGGDVLEGGIVRETTTSTNAAAAVEQNMILFTDHNYNHNREAIDNKKACIDWTRLGILMAWLCWLCVGIYCIGQQQQQQQQEQEEYSSCQDVADWMINGVSASFAAFGYNVAMGLCCGCLERQYKKKEERRVKRHYSAAAELKG